MGVEAQVRHLRIQRLARLRHPVKHIFAILLLQQRPGAIARQPLQLARHVDMQVHDEAARVHLTTVGGIQHRTAAGRDHPAFAGEQFSQHHALARAESRLAFTREDVGDAGSGMHFDLTVRIQEPQAQVFGQAATDRGLACSRRADQDEIGRRVHGHDLNNRTTSLNLRAERSAPLESVMSIAKVIELNAASKSSMEEAVRTGLKKCAETVKNIKGAWVNEIKVVTDDNGNVTEWRVNLRVTFVID